MDKKEDQKPDIRIAFLGVQADEYKPFEASLKNVFENYVESTGWFNWGHRLPNEYDRNLSHHDYERNDNNPMINMQVSSEVAVAVALLIEQVALARFNREMNPAVNWDKRPDSFSIAFYEVVDGKVGRIKHLDQCHFYSSGVGGALLAPANEDTKPFPTTRRTWEDMQVVGRGVLVTPEVREQLKARLATKQKSK